MNALTIVILAFSLLGAVDYVIGNKIGVGREFTKAFSLFCPMALSMLGMIVIAPAIGVWLTPVFEGFYDIFKIDPSVIPASLFANDMGGVTLSQTVGKSETLSNFNAFASNRKLGCEKLCLNVLSCNAVSNCNSDCNCAFTCCNVTDCEKCFVNREHICSYFGKG